MRSKTALLILGGLAVLYLAAAPADTPIYKWVDDQGKVHYSTEPHGDKAQQLAIQNSATTPNASTTPAPANATKTYTQDSQLVQPQPADSPACKAGRDRLFKYLHADNLYSVDDKGKKTTLSAADRQKALDEARDYVRQACNGGGA